MLEKPNALHTLGLTMELASLRGAYLSLLRGKPCLEQIFEIQVETEVVPNDNVNPLYMTKEGKILQQLLKKCLVTTALNTSDVLVRDIEIKLKKQKDVDAVLAFQTEPLLPYTADEGVVDRIVLSKTNGSTLLSVLAVRKDHLARHIERWHSFQVEPEVVSCVPAGLASFSSLFSPAKDLHAVVNLGSAGSTCVLVRKGKLLAAQFCRTGSRDLLQAFAKDRDTEEENLLEEFASLDFGTIDNEKTPRLYSAVENWRLQLKRVLFALEKQAKGEKLTELLITGEANRLPNLQESLCEGLDITVLPLLEDPQFPLTPEQLQKYAIPIGVALSTLPKGEDQINLRQEEFAFPDPWKRVKTPLSAYLGACLFLALAFYLFGNAYLGYQETNLQEEYVNLLASIEKPYPTFETEFTKKYTYEDVIEDPINLTEGDIYNRLQFLNDQLLAAPQTFPLKPNTPSVSDVLAWLSNHSLVQGEEGKPRLKLEKFSYKMVKRPEKKKQKEKYQVKVELEFSTPTPRYAREFHDALIVPNPIVDTKSEVQWTAARGNYRTSFFLKDRTVYP